MEGQRKSDFAGWPTAACRWEFQISTTLTIWPIEHTFGGHDQTEHDWDLFDAFCSVPTPFRRQKPKPHICVCVCHSVAVRCCRRPQYRQFEASGVGRTVNFRVFLRLFYVSSGHRSRETQTSRGPKVRGRSFHTSHA